MLKRRMIGLVAAGLVVIFIAEAAHALVIRRRNTVENIHVCEECLPGTGTVDVPCIPDLCFGADKVTDILTGWDKLNEQAICTMKGQLVCEGGGGACTDQLDTPLSIDDFFAGAEFIDEIASASDLAFLSFDVGQLQCDQKSPGSTFIKFWPDVFLAHSTYTDADTLFPNIEGDATTYELIEKCTALTGTDLYECVTLWDSTSTSEPPKLPCCGEENTLTVQIAGGVGGTVTSDDGNINDCPDTCVATYDGTQPPYDGCQEVTLTATPKCDTFGSCYQFTGWSGGGCSGTDPSCTFSPQGSPTVTASFEASYHTLTVQVIGDGTKDNVWFFDPDKNIVEFEATENCDDADPPDCVLKEEPVTNCFADYCYATFAPGTWITVKRKGGKFGKWDGVCLGIPNSADSCTFQLNKSELAIANFINFD